jgi:Mn2+/Fe2+ NRAMP family transporter
MRHTCDRRVFEMAIGFFEFALIFRWLKVLWLPFWIHFIIIPNQRYQKRNERLSLHLVAIISFRFCSEMIFAQPDLPKYFAGLIRFQWNRFIYRDQESSGYTMCLIYTCIPLWVAKLKTTDRTFDTRRSKQALKYNFIDSTIALNPHNSKCCNLNLAAATFYKNGMLEVAKFKTHKF